ncbi:MAG: zinc ribbon domain-containing protein [Candidatus Hodarchaeota archaeon]
MSRVTQVYPLKLPQKIVLRQQVDNLYKLGKHSSQQLLERLWSEEWLDRLANAADSNKTKKKKVYKLIGEKQVVILSSNGKPLYLPSRVRRCIAEQVGRILRSQVTRRKCYYDVLHLVQQTGIEKNLDKLVRIIAQTLVMLEGKYYRRALIRQALRTFRRYHYKLGLDLAVLTSIPYTKMVKPVIWSFVFPFAPDDGQVIQQDWVNNTISIRLKLPRTNRPLTRQDWSWQEFTLSVPAKIHQRIVAVTSQIHAPTLRYITLKSGLTLPFLDYAWSFVSHPSLSLNDKRVLATDLGVINLTTSVICEAGSQLSRPMFWSANKSLLHKIDQHYHHISCIQKKLDCYPEFWVGQGKRREERARLYRKLNRYRELILHLISNHLLETALRWQCRTLVLEDLRSYNPPKHKRKLSRKLSNWLRGSLYEILVYKANRLGIRVKRVLARWTSSSCPRCGQKGKKIRDPCSKTVVKKGRFFYCPHCHYSADRDYLGALNIYRMYQEWRKKRYSLKLAKPLSYMGIGIPCNRPPGASVQILLNG